jgi:peptidoglycan/xylan/chitin deacetylase (PgdA/CDA1 family)
MPSPTPRLPTHDRFDYVPLPGRKDYSWPGGKRLAMYLALNIETFGYGMELGPVLGGALPKPDHRNWSWREYGTRVGVWRLFDLFDELALPCAHLVNSYLYDTHPQIFEPIRRRGDELIGHGRTNSERPGAFDEAGERELIAEATQAIARREGKPPRGWMPPLMSQSPVTLDLLKEAGYRFVLDWPCDDQPYWMRTRAGPILAVPYPLETNDIVPILQLHHDPLQFVETAVRQFEEMVEQSERAPLVFAISLHTMIFGQPHRLRALRDGLRRIRAHPRFDRVWLTKPGEIADYCASLPAGVVPGS